MYSASDLAAHLACSFLTSLERAAMAGKVERPWRRDDALEVLAQRGRDHEARYLAELRGQGVTVTDVTFDRSGGAAAIEAAARATEQAMRRGDPAIYQATLRAGAGEGTDPDWRCMVISP